MEGDNVPDVKHEDNVSEDNPPEEIEQVVEITPMLPPEVEIIEMVGVEEGGDDDDDDDTADESLGVDPVHEKVGRVAGRLSRSRARSLGLDPLHNINEEPSTWDANRNLMLRPRGGEDGCVHRDEVGEVQELLPQDLPM